MLIGRPSLDEFLRSPERSGYVYHRDLSSYVRKSLRVIDNRRVVSLDRASTTNEARSRNVGADPLHTSTGLYREFDDLMRRRAVDFRFDGVFVENVLNEFLPGKLLEMGYRMVGASFGCPCFWWAAPPVGMPHSPGGWAAPQRRSDELWCKSLVS